MTAYNNMKFICKTNWQSNLGLIFIINTFSDKTLFGWFLESLKLSINLNPF